MQQTLAEFRNLDRRVWVLSAARMVATWAFSMVLPLLAVHLSADRGVRVPMVGAILTASGICGALMQSYAGALCDRTGRVPLLIGASVFRTVILLALGMAIGARAPIYAIALLIVLNNMARGFFDPPAQAMVADLAPAQQRVAAFALQRIGINIGFTAGPAVGTLASYLGVPYHQTFYWGVPISILATLGVLSLRRPGSPATDPPRPASQPSPPLAPPVARKTGWAALLEHRQDREFMRFLRATFVFFMLQVQLFVALPVFASKHLGLSHAEVMSIFVVNGVLVVLLQIPAASVINKIGRDRALVLGCLGYVVGYATVGAAIGPATILLSVAAVTVSEVILSPAQHTQVTTMAPAGRVGTYAGLFGLCQIAGQSVGPLVGTVVLDLAPTRISWIILAAFGVVAARWYQPGPRFDAPGDGPQRTASKATTPIHEKPPH